MARRSIAMSTARDWLASFGPASLSKSVIVPLGSIVASCCQAKRTPAPSVNVLEPPAELPLHRRRSSPLIR